MAATLEEFLADRGPRRALPPVCLGCGHDVVFEPYFGIWSHVENSFCRDASTTSFYVPRRTA